MMIDYEKINEDVEWILTALQHPTYLDGKGDRSNMFPLNDNSPGYVRAIAEELEEKGYKTCIQKGGFISIIE